MVIVWQQSLVHTSTSHAILACEFPPLAKKVVVVMHNGSYNMLFCVAHCLSRFTVLRVVLPQVWIVFPVWTFHNSRLPDSTACMLPPELLCNITYVYLRPQTWPFLLYRLLDILAGRKSKSGLSGIVLVNGDRQPNNFKCISGYVVQVGPCACFLIPSDVAQTFGR